MLGVTGIEIITYLLVLFVATGCISIIFSNWQKFKDEQAKNGRR